MLVTEQETSPAPGLLLSLKGIGSEFAAVLWSEGLSRQFDNRRQVAAYAGLAPTPWQSGKVDHDQGVSKSGKSSVTNDAHPALLAVDPPSARLGTELVVQSTSNAKWWSAKEVSIVAPARKLLIALSKYVNAGVVIEGAVVTAS